LFSKYYQSELSYLREMGRAFAVANPSLAGLLAERGGDPDVERLLEGFAFLSAQIRERTENAVPEVIHGLMELLLPHYLRPLPACSIVEFTPQPRALRGRLRVPRGTEIATAPVEQTSCLFRTTAELELLPVALADAAVEYPSATAPTLRLLLQLGEQGRPELIAARRLRFFLHGELPLSTTLLLWLFRHCRGISLRDPSSSAPAVRLSPAVLRPLGLDPAEALFPWPQLAPHGFRLVQEFFTLPQKFLFFELGGLEVAPPAKEQLEIRFDFDRPPPLPARVGREAVRLHCVPVINLFRCEGEPLRLAAPGQEHLVRAAGVNPLHMEVYSVESVVGVRPGGERHTYSPFVDFRHAENGSACYRLRRAPSPVNDGIDTYLALATPRDASPYLGPETLSLELTCTNRSLPSQLRIGDLSVPTASSPTIARFSNLLPVAKPARPPLGSELHWRLLSHLSLGHRSLATPDALRSLLGLYNFQVQGDYPLARANALRLDSIRGVQSSAARRFLLVAPVRGQKTVVELDESGFAGPGDLFLFGWILDELFANNLTLNSFNELSVRFFPSRMEYTWPARSGSQPLL